MERLSTAPKDRRGNRMGKAAAVATLGGVIAMGGSVPTESLALAQDGPPAVTHITEGPTGTVRVAGPHEATGTIEKIPSGPMIGSLVCDGLFTQEMKPGEYRVVGRPVVNTYRQPDSVVVGDAGVQTSQADAYGGKIAWYNMQGKPVQSNEVSCEATGLYGRQVTDHGRSLTVVSTQPAAPAPERWDFSALQPDGFGGAHLDYTGADHLMSGAEVAEVVSDIQAKAAHGK